MARIPSRRTLIYGLFILGSVLYVAVVLHPGMYKRTYVSENALMSDYASGTYSPEMRKEAATFHRRLVDSKNDLVDELQKILGEVCGHDVVGAHNKFNVYGVCQAMRGDGTEGLVLMAPFRTLEGRINMCGISFLLASINRMKESRFWSRDFVLLFPGIGLEDTSAVSQQIREFLDFYHSEDAPTGMRLTSAVLQAGLSIEIEASANCSAQFGDARLLVEGHSGLLPNLDLINTIVNIQRNRGTDLKLHSRHSTVQKIFDHLIPERFAYARSAIHVLGMILRQAFGWPLHSHGRFMDYRIDAVTLSFREISDTVDNEYFVEHSDRNMFELVELTCRSLSNILEHLHQSFFSYLLSDESHFVSISTFIALGAIPIVALLLHSIASIGDVKSSLASLGAFTVFSIINAAAVALFQRFQLGLFLLLPLIISLLIPSKWMPSNLRPVGCLIMAHVLIGMILLNFGLTVIIGFMYAPLLILAHMIPSPVLLLFNPLVLFFLAYSTSNACAIHIGKSLLTWNAGVPFVVLPSIVLLSIHQSNTTDQIKQKTM